MKCNELVLKYLRETYTSKKGARSFLCCVPIEWHHDTMMILKDQLPHLKFRVRFRGPRTSYHTDTHKADAYAFSVYAEMR